MLIGMSNWRTIVGAMSLVAIGVAIALRKKRPMIEIEQHSLPCIFCNNESGSEEHIWPAWVHRHRKFGPLKMQEGNGPQVIADDPEQTVDTVCHTCNNTWMSQLEQKNIPSLKPMVDGKQIEIDPGRQRLLREWAVKTAMINDSTKVRSGIQMFYTQTERTAMRESRAIPPQTRIWLGVIDENWHIGIHGTDFTITNGAGLRFGVGTVSTIYMGCFLVQVVTEHIEPQYANPEYRGINPKPRNWDQKLIETWPTVPKKMLWPPPVPFTNGGKEGIAYLMDRWRMGTEVKAGAILAGKDLG
jgi:hypothetical protein